MTGLKREWVKAAEIVRDAGGRIVGRTKLQKIAYLLELCGLGEGFQFEYRHYGPYSEGLSQAIKMADAFGLVREEERAADWGGTYSIYSTTEQEERASEPRIVFARTAAQIAAIELELAATAAYLRATERCADPWEETRKLKPEKATNQRLQAAKKAYANAPKIGGASASTQDLKGNNIIRNHSSRPHVVGGRHWAGACVFLFRGRTRSALGGQAAD